MKNILKTEFFENYDVDHDNHLISLTEFSSQKKLPVIIAFSNFSSASVDEKHLTRFQSENAVFKFLRRSVAGTL